MVFFIKHMYTDMKRKMVIRLDNIISSNEYLKRLKPIQYDMNEITRNEINILVNSET